MPVRYTNNEAGYTMAKHAAKTAAILTRRAIPARTSARSTDAAPQEDRMPGLSVGAIVPPLPPLPATPGRLWHGAFHGWLAHGCGSCPVMLSAGFHFAMVPALVRVSAPAARLGAVRALATGNCRNQAHGYGKLSSTAFTPASPVAPIIAACAAAFSPV